MAPGESPTAPAGTEPRKRRWVRTLLLVLVPLLILDAVIWWWLDRGNRLFFPRKWGVVVEGRLYRSGRIDAGLVEDALKDHAIAVVVDLAAGEPENADVRAEREAARRLGIRVVEVRGLEGDGTGDVAGYVTAVTEMARAAPGKAVLVHCTAGSERTGVAVALYRMLVEGWDGVRAYDEYLGYRRHPPTDDHLVRFVNEHVADVASRLAAAGVLGRVPSPLPSFGP